MQLRYKVDSAPYKYIYIVKPRQFGFTTDAAIDMLDDACFVPGKSGAIIAHDRETLGKIFNIIKRAYENMPKEIRPSVKYDTRNEYKFTHRYDRLPLDNDLYVALNIRGSTVQRLHVSEAAYISDRGGLKTGAKQAVPIGGKIVEESTANGMDEYYDDVMAAWEKQKAGTTGPMDYHVIFYAWFENPEYTLPGILPGPDIEQYGNEAELRAKYKLTDGQLLFRRWKINEMRGMASTVTLGLSALQKFKQEYPSTLLEAFQAGSGNVFNAEIVDNIKPPPPLRRQDGLNLYKDAANNPRDKEKLDLFNRIYEQGVSFWKLPVEGREYVIGCDPSDGQGSDYGVIDVWDKDGLEQVAQFYGKRRPDELAQLCADLGNLYNEAYIGVENNMLATALFLSKIYDFYYSETRLDQRTNKRTKTIGWNTNGKTRDLMIDDFVIFWELGDLIINSPYTLAEMKTFIKNPETGKREHAKGKHDDALFSPFIAIQMRRAWPGRTRVIYRQ